MVTISFEEEVEKGEEEDNEEEEEGEKEKEEEGGLRVQAGREYSLERFVCPLEPSKT